MALGGSTKAGSYGVVSSTGQVLAPGSGAVSGSGGGCPGNVGKIKQGNLWVCPPAAAAAGPAGGGALNFSMPAGRAPPPPPPAPPAAVERPGLTPIDPQAAYDPEIAAQLARQRSYTGDLKAGTGFAMDVLTGQQRDVNEEQMREAG